jgi:hypothetical protein
MLASFVYRTLALFLLSQLSVAIAAVQVTSTADKTLWDVTIEGIDFSPVSVDGRSFVRAKLRGIKGYEGITSDAGRPELPVVTLWVDGDGDLQVETDTAQAAETLTPLRAGVLVPSIPSAPKLPGAKRVFVMDTPFYQTDGSGAHPPYEIATIGTVRGRLRRLVTLYPFQYNPAANSGTLTLHFRVTLRSKPTEIPADATEVLAWVVPEKLANSPALKKYREFKESLGYQVELVSIAAGEAKPEIIRGHLRDLYASYGQALTDAMLIGTNDAIPGYPSPRLSGVTDHYYRCLDTDDYEHDVGAPDIGVGRLSVHDEKELAVQVDKLIAYQQGQFANDDWLRKISYIASDDSDNWPVVEGTDDYVVSSYTRQRGYSGDFPKASELGGDKLYAVTFRATTADVLSHLAEGRGIINYGGHGGPDEWVGPQVSISDVLALKSAAAIPLVIANACETADFRDGNSIGEAWQRAPHGAVAYLGSMDFTYWDEDDIFERRMYDGIFAHGLSRLDEITAYAGQELWRYYGGKGRSQYYDETYVTLGDPSLSIRTWATRGVKIWGPKEVSGDTGTVSYRIVDENNLPVSGARVALTSPSYDYRSVALTDESGSVTLTLGMGSRFHVAVSGTNLRLASQDLRRH